MSRKAALDWIRIHTAQGNESEALRVYVENRVSFEAFQEARSIGLKQRGSTL